MNDLIWILSFLKQKTFTIVLSNLAILSGIYVSLSGLATWKRKLKGEQTYHLAKKMIVGVNKYKHAVFNARNPVVWSSEYPKFTETELGEFTKNELESIKKEYVYMQRWRNIDEKRMELYESILEAKALWPKLGLEDLFDEIYKHVHQFWIEMHIYIRSDNYHKRQYVDKIIFAIEENDEFAKKLDELTLKIEKKLAKKLRKM